MRKILLSSALLISMLAAKSQCNDIFISEYVEGSGNNKALELYNPTASPINLNGQYTLTRYNNGTGFTAETNTQATINLGSPIIPAYSTYVIVINLVDPLGSGQTLPADTALQAKADTFLCDNYNTNFAMFFNGNDALSVRKDIGGGNFTYVDIFGKIGEDPGASWTDIAPYTDAAGAYWTLNQTLVRKPSILGGVTTNPSLFNAPAEYDSLPVNTFYKLGSHDCNCNPFSVQDLNNSESFKIYPNPAQHDFKITATSTIATIEIVNALGQTVTFRNIKEEESKSINVSAYALSTGIYFIKVKLKNGFEETGKLIRN